MDRLIARRTAALALVLASLAACGGGGGGNDESAAPKEQRTGAEAKAEAKYGDLPGAAVTYADIDAETDCAALQTERDRWQKSHDRRKDDDDRREILEAYVQHADERLEALDCPATPSSTSSSTSTTSS